MTIRPFSEIVTELSRLTSEPILSDKLIPTSTLSSSEHATYQFHSEQSMKRQKSYGVEKHSIEGFDPHQRLRDISKQVQDLKNIQESTFNQQTRFQNNDILQNGSLQKLREIPIRYFEKAIKNTNPKSESYGIICRNFARMLSPYMQVRLEDIMHSRVDLCKKGILIDSQDALSYRYLAEIMKEEGLQEVIIDQKTMSLTDLYLKIIEIRPNEGKSYTDLANCLNKNESIILQDKALSQKDLILLAVQQDSNHFESYLMLGQQFRISDIAQGLSKGLRSKRALFLKAIQLNPQDGRAYMELANLLERDESIEIYNRGFLDKKELYQKAIELNVKLAKAYFELAHILEDDESISLKGRIWSKKELYQKASKLDSQPLKANLQIRKRFAKKKFVDNELSILLEESDSQSQSEKDDSESEMDFYVNSPQSSTKSSELQEDAFHFNLSPLLETGRFDSEEDRDIKEHTVEQGKKYEAVDKKNLVTQQENALDADEYIQIVDSLKNNKAALIWENDGSQLDLYQIAVNIESQDNQKKSLLYAKLAEMVPHSTGVINQQIKRINFYSKSLEYNPYQSKIYLALYDLIGEEEEIKLKYHGKEKLFIRKELKDQVAFIEKIEKVIHEIEKLENKNEVDDPILHRKKIARRYNNLANYLKDDEILISPYKNIIEKTKKDLYLKCIDLDPKHGLYYVRLGSLLQEDKTITLLNNTEVNKTTLYTMGVKFAPVATDVYCKIADCLTVNEEITLDEKIYAFEKISRKILYLKAIQIDPKNADLYCYLADVLYHADDKDEKVCTINGTHHTLQSLYIKSIELGPVQANPYLFLALRMENPSILILGKDMSYKDLLIRAVEKEIKLNHLDKERSILAYLHLAYAIENPYGHITINGSIVRKDYLYSSILNLNPRHPEACQQLLNSQNLGESFVLDDGTKLSNTYLKKIASQLAPAHV